MNCFSFVSICFYSNGATLHLIFAYALLYFSDDRINFKVFKWSIKKANGRIKNWSYSICEMLKSQNLEAYCNFENNIITRHTILQIDVLYMPVSSPYHQL
jgi:hypothetical protein